MEQVESLVRAEQEPHAVRRADDRVDGREGGARCRASGRWSPRVIYNRLHRADDARHRRDDPLRAARPARRSRSRSRISQNPTPYNTRLHDGLPPTPITTRGWRRSRRRRIQRTSTTCTSCASRTQAPLLHGELPGLHPARGRSTATVTGCVPARASGRALAVAPDAERGLRGGRPRLGVRRARRPAGRARGGGGARSSTRTSRRRTSSTSLGSSAASCRR